MCSLSGVSISWEALVGPLLEQLYDYYYYHFYIYIYFSLFAILKRDRCFIFILLSSEIILVYCSSRAAFMVVRLMVGLVGHLIRYIFISNAFVTFVIHVLCLPMALIRKVRDRFCSFSSHSKGIDVFNKVE